MGYRVTKKPFSHLKPHNARILQDLLNEEIKKGTIIPCSSREEGYRMKDEKLDLQYLSSTCRPSTPHPGSRVPTVWDYEITEQETDDVPLSTEQLAIHTPPDSPKMGRQNTPSGCQTWEEHAREIINKTGQLPQMDNELEVFPSIDAYQRYLRMIASYNHYKELVKTRKRLAQKNDTDDLQRKERTRRYVNDQQGLILVDETPYRTAKKHWTEEAEEEYQQQQKTISSARKSIRYLRDWRNIKHASISWTACVKDICSLHLQDKEGAQWFPSRDSYCKYQWFDCPRHTCSEHLWDKRTSGSFHPHDESFEAAQKILINGSCTFPLWHQCLQEACEKHQEDKVDNGYLDLGAEETYSDPDTEEESEQDNESFLGLRLAPGTEPGAATLPIRPHSTNSQ